MLGARGEALTTIGADGQVRYRGEIWSARAQDREIITAGEHVTIIKVEGLRLIVEKAGHIHSTQHQP